MANTTLIRVLGLFGVICVVAITAILIWYPGTTSEKLVAAGVIGGLITVIGGQLLNLKQSGDNASALADIAPKVDQAATQSRAAVKAVADNTQLTQDTHELVDGQAHEWRAGLEKIAAQQAEMAAQKAEIALQKAEIAAMVELTRTTLAELKARREGVIEGRGQVTGADMTVLEAPVLIVPPVEP